MNFTVHFSVTVPEPRDTDIVFVTGSEEALGLWNPTLALPLEKKTENVFVGSVTLGNVQKLKFRYFLGYYLQGDVDGRTLIIRKWETHLNARCVLPAIEACKNNQVRTRVNDVFGFHAGREKVSDGWLHTDNQQAIHLAVRDNALKFFKAKHADQKYSIRITPFDVRNRNDAGDDPDDDALDDAAQQNLTSYSETELAPLTDEDPRFHRQGEFGHALSTDTDAYLMFRTISVAVEYLGFQIEIFKAGEATPKLQARGIALPSTLPNSYGTASVPLLAPSGLPVGKAYVDYLFVRPLRGGCEDFRMDVSFAKHWKKRTTLEVGHRGMGNSYTSFAVARENTLHSLNGAASHGADYVEFDVQLTKDKQAVIFHDFHVLVSMTKRFPSADDTPEEGHEVAVKDLKLSQLRLLHLNHVKHGTANDGKEDVLKVTGSKDEAEELRPFPTLVGALQSVSPDVGFNVEIKFPMVLADGIDECENYFEHNLFIDTILSDVFKHAGNRRIVFSSFCPDICVMIAAKQNKYPVLFLCCGANTRHQVYQDPRTRTSNAAVAFVAASGLLGVNFHSEDVLRDPAPIAAAKKHGLISFVWGDELNTRTTVDHFKKLGVDGVIYDRIGEINVRSNVFLLEKAKESQLFKKSSHPPTPPRIGSVHQLVGNNGTEAATRPVLSKDAPADWPIPAPSRRSPTAEDVEFTTEAPLTFNDTHPRPRRLTTYREV